MTRAAHTEVVAAPAAACFDVMADFAAYPSWQRAMRAATVIEPAGAGSGPLVEFRLDAKVREVRYVVRYRLERPHRIGWDYVEGDARSFDGEQRFEDLGDGTTRCTYEIAIDVGRFVPGRLQRSLAEEAVRTTLQALKRRVEA